MRTLEKRTEPGNAILGEVVSERQMPHVPFCLQIRASSNFPMCAFTFLHDELRQGD